MINALYILLTYLFASIPFGYIITKWSTGQNILEFGSGNVGSTNVKRAAGKKMAAFTQLLDMLKGLLPVSLFYYFSNIKHMPLNDYLVFYLAFAAILGHNFSLFLKLKGGKGVNTTLGASLLINPIAVLIAVSIYYVVKWRYKYVSLGSLAIAIALPVFTYFFNYSTSQPFKINYLSITNTFYYMLSCALFIVYKHRSNIQRLINGEENSV